MRIAVTDIETERDEDTGMAEVAVAEDSEGQDEVTEIDPPNWRDEVRKTSVSYTQRSHSSLFQLIHILFTHSLPPAKVPTMQLLLDAFLSPTATEEQQNVYRAACTRLLESLGTLSRPELWDDHLREIAHVLVGMARILADTTAVRIISVLDLVLSSHDNLSSSHLYLLCSICSVYHPTLSLASPRPFSHSYPMTNTLKPSIFCVTLFVTII